MEILKEPIIKNIIIFLLFIALVITYQDKKYYKSLYDNRFDNNFVEYSKQQKQNIITEKLSKRGFDGKIFWGDEETLPCRFSLAECLKSFDIGSALISFTATTARVTFVGTTTQEEIIMDFN